MEGSDCEGRVPRMSGKWRVEGERQGVVCVEDVVKSEKAPPCNEINNDVVGDNNYDTPLRRQVSTLASTCRVTSYSTCIVRPELFSTQSCSRPAVGAALCS